MLKSKVLNELIGDRFEYAIDYFNFYKVKMAMNALEWGWATTGGKVPTVIQMENNVRYLFEEALKLKSTGEKCSVSMGGFEVEITEDNTVNISFTLENTSSFGYNSR